MTNDARDTARSVRTSLRSSHERTIGQLVAQATQDVSVIVRKEIQLAKTEVTSQLGTAGKGAGMLIAAGILALYALGLLLIAASFGLVALGLSIWLSFLIVAVVLLIVVAVLALVGRRAMQRVNPRPDRAIASAQQTIAAVKDAGASGSEHAKAVPAANAQVAIDQRPSA